MFVYSCWMFLRSLDISSVLSSMLTLDCPRESWTSLKCSTKIPPLSCLTEYAAVMTPRHRKRVNRVAMAFEEALTVPFLPKGAVRCSWWSSPCLHRDFGLIILWERTYLWKWSIKCCPFQNGLRLSCSMASRVMPASHVLLTLSLPLLLVDFSWLIYFSAAFASNI